MHDRIRDVLPMGADIDVRSIYGIEGYVTRGILFAASQDGDLLVRLDPESRMEALELSGATSWSPSDDADSYVIIPNYLLNSDETLRYWVMRALDYAEALGIDGDDEDVEMEPYDDYDRSARSDTPAEANGAHHGEDEDDMEGEEVRLPPPASRPKAARPRPVAAPAPAAESKPEPAKAPAAPMKPAAAKKSKPAPKKKAAARKAKPAAKKKAAPRKAAGKSRPAPKKKPASRKAKPAPKKKVAVKRAKPAARKKAAGKKSKAAPKKKAAVKKAKPAPRKKVAAKKKPATKKSPARKKAKRR